MFNHKENTLTLAGLAFKGINAASKAMQGGGNLTTLFIMIPDADGRSWRVGSQLIQSCWLPGWRKQLFAVAEEHKAAMRENGVTQFEMIETTDPVASSRSHRVWPPAR